MNEPLQRPVGGALSAPPTGGGPSAHQSSVVRVEALVTRLSRLMGVLSGVALVSLLVHVALDVASRNLLGVPIPGTLEMITYIWMPSVVFLAIPLTEARLEHIRVSVVDDRVADHGPRWSSVLIAAVGTTIAAMLLVFATTSALDSFDVGQTSTGALPIPIWPAKMVMVIGLSVLVLQMLVRVVVLSLSVSRARPATTRARGMLAVQLAALGAAIVSGAAIQAGDLTRETVGLLILIILVSLMVTGVHIYLAMAAAAATGLLQLAGPVATASSLRELIFGSTATWSLSVIPAFIFMGVVLWKSGLTGAAFAAATRWLRNLPGGLAIGTNFAGAGLAAASGSSVGISYSLGRIAIPEMLKRGYDPSLATGVAAVSGTLGQLIPPSILLVVYAGVAQTPVGPQLLAAIVPGILLALLYGLMIGVRAYLKPSLAPRVDEGKFPLVERISSLGSVAPLGIVVAIVIGGIVSGLFTATEAGAIGALVALAIGMSRRPETGQTRRTIARDSVLDTVAAVGAVFALLIGVALLQRAMTLSRVTNSITDAITGLGLPLFGFLLVLVVVYLLLGTFLDPLAIILLTMPVLGPTLDAYGINPIWFGIFIVLVSELGLVTPPVGLLTFVVHRLAQDPAVNQGIPIGLTTVFKGVGWFVAMTIILVLAIMVFPDIVTWLPDLAGV